MRTHVKKENPYVSHFEDKRRSWVKEKQFWDHAQSFVEKNIGKNYDRVYSEFCHKFPRRISDIDTRQYFKNLFDKNHRICSYTIDENKNIKSVPPKYRSRRKPVVQVPSENNVETIIYKIDKRLLKLNPNWKDVLKCRVGMDEYYINILDTRDELTELEFNTIRRRWYLKLEKINFNNPDNPILQYTFWPKYTKTPKNIGFYTDITKKYVKNSSVYTYPKGYYMYEKITAEQRDAYKKTERTQKKEKEENNSTALQREIERRKKLSLND
jgi:hypothetical protein